MSALGLREIAVVLGGEVTGRQVLAPGPGHSRLDRSLSVRLSSTAPGGFIVKSFSDDPFDVCRDHVAARLGMPVDAWRSKGPGEARPIPTFTPREPGPAPDHAARIARAVAIWNEASPAQRTIVETYLSSRGLSLDLVYNVHDVIRYHARCLWRDEAAGQTIYVPCMVALMRSVATDEPQGIHRTRLSAEGAKVGRRMLGIAAGAAIKLDTDEDVTGGLHIAEGIETALAARQLGFRPCWALASAGGIKAFPLLSGVEALTILGENDDTNRRAVEECAERWHRAGREVIVVKPASGSDILDAMRGAV